MNQKWAIVEKQSDGKKINEEIVVISDENGNLRFIPKTDSYEKVLYQENLVEKIRNDICELEKQKKGEKDLLKSFFKHLTKKGAITVLIATSIFLFLKSHFVNIDFIFNLKTAIESLCLVGLVIAFPTIVIKKCETKTIKSINRQIEYLKEELQEQEQNLRKLNEENSREVKKLEELAGDKIIQEEYDYNESQACHDFLEIHDSIAKNLVIYRDFTKLGKYYRLNKKGKLESFLDKKGYSLDQIRAIKAYLETFSAQQQEQKGYAYQKTRNNG